MCLQKREQVGTTLLVRTGVGDSNGQEGVRPSPFLATSALPVQAPQAESFPQLAASRGPTQVPRAPEALLPTRLLRVQDKGPLPGLVDMLGRPLRLPSALAPASLDPKQSNRLTREAWSPGFLHSDVQRSARSTGPTHNLYLSEKVKPGPQPSPR